MTQSRDLLKNCSIVYFQMFAVAYQTCCFLEEQIQTLNYDLFESKLDL